MVCFVGGCGSILSAGMTAIEVGGMYCCPRHVREVSIGYDGHPVRPEPIHTCRPPYTDG